MFVDSGQPGRHPLLATSPDKFRPLNLTASMTNARSHTALYMLALRFRVLTFIVNVDYLRSGSFARTARQAAVPTLCITKPVSGGESKLVGGKSILPLGVAGFRSRAPLIASARTNRCS